MAPVLKGGPAPRLVTDPARGAAARDTLLALAAQMRERVVQGSVTFVTNAGARPRRRVKVTGTVPPPAASVSVVSVPGGGTYTQTSGVLTWKHITRYRRNGRVQEKFRIKLGSNMLLRQRWLNGAVTWLSIPLAYPGITNLPIRHRGLYLRTGYLLLDGEEYVLLPK